MQSELFSTFLEGFKAKLHHAFYVVSNIDQFSLERGIPPAVMQEIMSCNPLSVGIPKEYGGRGGHIDESLAILAAASYESLALSLTFGINWALFLQPVAKYGNEEIKPSIFRRFLEDKSMGGLMITEPEHGTSALSMQTSFVENGKYYNVQGIKHWGGLTGWADFWLVAARQQGNDGKLKRDINFFVCDVSKPAERIIVEEVYDNLGLYIIPYGLNKVNVKVPKIQKLEPQSTGIKMMLDTLYRSRMQFPGMAMGFIKRMLDEALKNSKERFVSGKNLLNCDQVQQRLAHLQAAFTICSAMCAYTSKHANIKNNLLLKGIEANAIKSVVTDLMQEVSQSTLQLLGAKGYRLSHIAGRATIDSRPFQIFEGPNDILYIQTSEAILKLMKQAKEKNLFQFLKNYSLTAQVAEKFKETLNFNVDLQIPQRKLTELGRVLGRIICMEMVFNLKKLCFRKDLITGALTMLEQEITNLVGTYRFANSTKVIVEYEENSSWMNLG